MRRPFAWLAWGTGALVALRWQRLRRRRPEVAAADPAAELRRKLDESRAEPAEPAEPPPPVAEPPPAEQAGVDERRRDVHDRGRAVIDRMRSESPPD